MNFTAGDRPANVELDDVHLTLLIRRPEVPDADRVEQVSEALQHPRRIPERVLTLPGHRRLPHIPDLREINFGVWDGMRFDAVAARDPQLSRDFWEKPGDVQAPEGESWNQTMARVNAAVDRLSAEHFGAHIIAVAHFGVILTQVQRALGVSAYEAMAHKIDNISITTIKQLSGDQWDVEGINHLP